MKPLFAKSNLDTLTVQELVNAVQSNQKYIQLPVFQRDAVWDEARIELLWDSILRGFPIGYMLFARSQEDIETKELLSGQEGYSPSQAPSKKTEFIMIDGQQRANAITLGLTPWNDRVMARLWVDLGMPQERSGKGTLAFHVCSWQRPWGERATDHMQREALAKLEREKMPPRRTRLEVAWPLRARLPVPLAELLEQLRHTGTADWRTLLPSHLQEEAAEPRPDLDDFLQQLQKALSYTVPLLLTEQESIDDLGLIFDRLNRQGIPLSAEDLFFSALKLRWPDAHDLVWEIYDDRETGRFMPPTKIVHLSMRLVAARCNDSDIIDLTQVEFNRRLGKPADSQGKASPYLAELKWLLKPGNNRRVGKLTSYLRQARRALSYRPAGDDPGLPNTLLRRLRWRVWHTITAWIAQHPGEVDEESRREMLRYACLDHFYIKGTSSRLERIPFQIAAGVKGTFPGRKIYEVLRDEELLEPADLLTPEQFQVRVMESENPVWAQIQHEGELIMWAQRASFAKWFADFDPTLYRQDSDLPYHADHIIPRAHLNMAGLKNWEELPQLFKDWRQPVLWSPGNIRYWPRGLNVQDGQRNLKLKHLLGAKDSCTDESSYLRNYELMTVGAVRHASFIHEDEVPDWEVASNGGVEGWPAKDWRYEERIRAFRRAVDARRVRAYQTFFDQMCFHTWLNT